MYIKAESLTQFQTPKEIAKCQNLHVYITIVLRKDNITECK